MAPILSSSSLFIELWFHGLYSALMLSTLHMIVTANKIVTHRKIWQIGMILIPYACSTIHMSTDWLLAESAIDNNESPNGPGVIFSLTHTPAWETGMSLTAFATNIFLADCVVIWRCWTVWGRRWVVVILPILCSITGAVIAGITIADQIIDALDSESMFAAQKTVQFVRFSTVFFSLSIATSMMTSLLIAARILAVQRATGKAGLDARNTYNSAIEIVIESAAIYSVTLLAFIIILTRHHTPTSQFFSENVHAQIAGIAPLLIIYRIAARHARPDSEWDDTAVLSAVQFVHNPQSNTSGAITDIGDSIIVLGGSKGSLKQV